MHARSRGGLLEMDLVFVVTRIFDDSADFLLDGVVFGVCSRIQYGFGVSCAWSTCRISQIIIIIFLNNSALLDMNIDKEANASKWLTLNLSSNSLGLTLYLQFTAFISSYAQLYGMAASTLSPYVIGYITNSPSVYSWKYVFYMLAAVLAVTGLIFQMFGHGEQSSALTILQLLYVCYQMVR